MYWQQSIGSWKRFLTGFLSVSPVPLWTSSLHWWSFRKLFITELAAEHTVMSDDLVAMLLLLLLLFLTRIARPSICPAVGPSVKRHPFATDADMYSVLPIGNIFLPFAVRNHHSVSQSVTYGRIYSLVSKILILSLLKHSNNFMNVIIMSFQQRRQ